MDTWSNSMGHKITGVLEFWSDEVRGLVATIKRDPLVLMKLESLNTTTHYRNYSSARSHKMFKIQTVQFIEFLEHFTKKEN